MSNASVSESEGYISGRMPEASLESRGAKRWSAGLALLALLLFLGIALYGAVGLRGSDQYWYAGDVRMLNATGRGVTNAIYPGAMLGPRHYSPADLPPFVHNQPATYAVALLGRIVDPYRAWLLSNLALTLGTAALLLALGRRIVPPPFPALTTALFLVFPFTVWLAINALSDMQIAFGGVAFALGVQTMSERRAGWGLLVAASSAAFLYWSRESFVLLLPALAMFAFVQWRRKALSPLIGIAAIATLTVVFAARASVLPGYPHAGLGTALMALTPSSPKGNMHPYYSYAPQAIDPPAVALRIVRELGVSLVPNGLTELATETLVLVVAAIALWGLRRDRETAPLRFVIGTYFAIYFLTAIAFQSHNRYLYVLTPLVMLLAARGLARRSSDAPLARRLAPALGVGALLVPLSFATAREYRVQALRERPMTARLTADLAREEPPGRPLGAIAIVGTFSQQVTYAVAPRNVIAIDGAYMTPEQGARLVTEWGARLFLIPHDGRDAAPGHAYAAAVAARLGARLVPAPIPSVPTQRVTLEAWMLRPGP